MLIWSLKGFQFIDNVNIVIDICYDIAAEWDSFYGKFTCVFWFFGLLRQLAWFRSSLDKAVPLALRAMATHQKSPSVPLSTTAVTRFLACIRRTFKTLDFRHSDTSSGGHDCQRINWLHLLNPRSKIILKHIAKVFYFLGWSMFRVGLTCSNFWSSLTVLPDKRYGSFDGPVLQVQVKGCEVLRLLLELSPEVQLIWIDVRFPSNSRCCHTRGSCYYIILHWD